VLGFAELSTPAKAVISLAFVLVLVVIAGLVLRRIAGGKLKLPGQGGRARQPRLGVVDVFELDRQRQLILLRRDNVEHLVMIGGPNDVVVEASIVRAAARTAITPLPDGDNLTAPVPADTQPPRGVMPARPPEPVSKPDPGEAGRIPPGRPEPAVGTQEPPKTREATLPPQAAKMAGTVAAGGLAAMGAAIAAGPGSGKRPGSASSEPLAGRPAEERTLPPLAAPAEFEAELQRALGDAPAPPIVEPILSAKPIQADPAELSEMARQLEEALKRPNSGVIPATTRAKGEAPVAGAPPAMPMLDPAMPGQVDPDPEPTAAQVLPANGVSDDTDADGSSAKETFGQVADGTHAADHDDVDHGRRGTSLAPADAPASEAALEIATLADAAALEEAIQAEIGKHVGEAPASLPQADGADRGTDLASALEAELAKAIALDVPGPDAAPVGAPVAPSPISDLPTAPSGFTMPQALEDELFAALTAAESKVVTQASAADMTPATVVEPEPLASADAGKAQDGKRTDSDPFSVEAIEAEFARLLNRSAPPKG
jgi:hypothetical protein